MENLVKNISKLIAVHNCVIMPGVGAFLAHRIPAYYNATEKLFMPSRRTLGFNPQVTVDDALLQSEYMSEGMLTYEEANDRLQNDIETLRLNLSNNGVLCFGDLGTFSMDINGKISFTPNENGIDDPYNYGFEPLAIAPLSEIKKKDIVIKRSSIGKYASIAAAIIVALFVLVPFGNSIYNSDIQLSVAGFTPVKSITTPSTPATEIAICEIAPVEETVTAHIFTTNETTPAVEETVAVELGTPVTTAAIEKAVEDAIEVIEENTKQYSIIVASTPNPEKAQLAITELSRKMEAEYKVVEGDRRFRIAIESYGTEADANVALKRIQETFSDAWVYIH
ncbi:MAG: SPOR domain-containing protein [Bacteroidaceae bacterium]|nr:SPOR domain-containing protein [Bacteroidaceae bacterium]